MLPPVAFAKAPAPIAVLLFEVVFVCKAPAPTATLTPPVVIARPAFAPTKTEPVESAPAGL